MGSSTLPSPSPAEEAPVVCKAREAAAVGPASSEFIVLCLPAMGDATFSDSLLDPSKWGELSLDEKKETVVKLSKCSQEAPEVLHSWSRKDLLEILCAEMGKERKYTGLTKHKLIEHLHRVVVEKQPGKMTENIDAASFAPAVQSPPKRQRINDSSPSVSASASALPPVKMDGGEAATDSICCKNSACRAVMSLNDTFCKRCSCCICRKFDDNKDPSLWLVCNSDPPFPGCSCGMSCHLDCALKHDKSGISTSKRGEKLDGSFNCVVCRKMNDLLGCWKKQLIIAKDARRLDVLCQRILLSYKLLSGSEKHKKLHANVEAAKNKLEAEVGPLNELPTGMARYIVNRLSCGAEVQKLCVSALELLEPIDPTRNCIPPPESKNIKLIPSPIIKLEDVSPTSLKVLLSSHGGSYASEPATHYSLWHKKADADEYLKEPTSKLDEPNRKFLVSDLTPGTEYLFKVVAFCNEKELWEWHDEVKTGDVLEGVPKSTAAKSHSEESECLKANSSEQSDPSSVADESNNAAVCADLNELPTKDILCCGDKDGNLSKDGSDFMEVDHSSDVGRTDTLGRPEETPAESGSALDEEPKRGTIAKLSSLCKDSTNSAEQNLTSDSEKFENRRTPSGSGGMMLVPLKNTDSALPVTPSRLETNLDPPKRTFRSKRSRQESMPQTPEKELTTENSSQNTSLKMIEKDGSAACNSDGSLEADYEYCVKVVRWLERKGHIEADFRVKFLTWFSLRATAQERRVVSVFVDTLIEDPPSLADQLVDTFSDCICNKPPLPATKGFCMRLWH